MKTKIFALIITILCLSVFLVACDKPCETHVDENNDASCDVCGEAVETETETETEGETETVGVCDHTDADADKLCDACGKAVVVIVEQVPVEKETAVDMVVNKIPTDVKLEDYIVSTLPEWESQYSTSGMEIEGFVTSNKEFVLKAEELEAGGYKYSVYDLYEDETLWSGEDKVTASKTVIHDVTLSELWFTVTTIESSTDSSDPDNMIEIKRSIKIYTYTAEQIGETYVCDDIDELAQYEPPVTDYFNGDQECYVIYGDKAYVIDPEEYDIIYSCDADTLVKRPVFDEIKDNKGYVYNYTYEYDEDGYIVDWSFEGVYVYDLTEWIDCEYSYELPGYAYYADAKALQNGNILIWYHIELADNAVSYDYISGGTKYDMVYKIVDINTLKIADVEFGYEISYVSDITEYDARYTEKARDYNLVVAYPVVDGRVDYNDELTLIVDNDLKIVCEDPNPNASLVADGLFVNYIYYNDETFTGELIDINGNHKSYLPQTTPVGMGIKIIDSRIYDLDNKLIIDLDEYTVHSDMNCLYYGGYMIVSKQVENAEGNTETVYYSVFAPTGEKTKLDTSKDNWTYVDGDEYEYQISYTVTDDEGVTKTYYELYNPLNKLLLTTQSRLYLAGEIVMEEEFWMMRLYVTGDGTYYVVE